MGKKLFIALFTVLLVISCATKTSLPEIEYVPETEISEIVAQEETSEPVAIEEPVVVIPQEEEAVMPQEEIAEPSIEAKTEEEVLLLPEEEVIAEVLPPEAEESVPEVALEEVVETPQAAEEKVETPVVAPEPEEKVFALETPEVEEEKSIVLGEDVITKSALSYMALQIMGCFIVIIVLFTVSVAIRSSSKVMLPRGISLFIAILFTGLPILISILVIGPSVYWCIYLLLLFSYFIFRAKDRTSKFE